jgi:hypothetical protein
MSLSTGRVLNQTHATKLPMPEEVVERVHDIARGQKFNQGLVFTDRNREPNDPDDDDEDDSTYYQTDGDTSFSNENRIGEDKLEDDDNDDACGGHGDDHSHGSDGDLPDVSDSGDDSSEHGSDNEEVNIDADATDDPEIQGIVDPEIQEIEIPGVDENPGADTAEVGEIPGVDGAGGEETAGAAVVEGGLKCK